MTRALACEASLPPMLREPSFLCAPVGDLDRLGPGIVALAGLFLDHGDQTAFGRRFAARQLRYACALDRIRSRAACVDLGDLNVFPLEPARQEAAFRRQFAAIAATGATMILIGGRRLMSPLGDYFDGAATIEAGTPVSTSVAGNLAAIVDLAPVLGFTARPRGLPALLDAVRALPRGRVTAVHVTGFAPELDVAGRREAALAAHVLQVLTDHLGDSAP